MSIPRSTVPPARGLSAAIVAFRIGAALLAAGISVVLLFLKESGTFNPYTGATLFASYSLIALTRFRSNLLFVLQFATVVLPLATWYMQASGQLDGSGADQLIAAATVVNILLPLFAKTVWVWEVAPWDKPGDPQVAAWKLLIFSVELVVVGLASAGDLAARFPG